MSSVQSQTQNQRVVDYYFLRDNVTSLISMEPVEGDELDNIWILNKESPDVDKDAAFIQKHFPECQILRTTLFDHDYDDLTYKQRVGHFKIIAANTTSLLSLEPSKRSTSNFYMLSSESPYLEQDKEFIQRRFPHCRVSVCCPYQSEC